MGEFPLPAGISRAEFLADHVKLPTVNGPLKQSKYWPDFIHAKSHHQQTSGLGQVGSLPQR